MKKILLTLLCLPLLSYAQHSDRVLEIKKMYKETISYNKKGDCKTISWIEADDGIGYSSEAVKCRYPYNYSRISLSLHLDHYFISGEYYFKNDNLYFLYNNHDSGHEQEDVRIYFKENGEIEKILVDYGDGNTKVNDRGEIARIKQNELRWLDTAVKELNKRK